MPASGTAYQKSCAPQPAAAVATCSLGMISTRSCCQIPTQLQQAGDSEGATSAAARVITRSPAIAALPGRVAKRRAVHQRRVALGPPPCVMGQDQCRRPGGAPAAPGSCYSALRAALGTPWARCQLHARRPQGSGPPLSAGLISPVLTCKLCQGQCRSPGPPCWRLMKAGGAGPA